MPDLAQVGRFSSWGTSLPIGFLAEVSYSHCEKVALPRPSQRGHPRIRVNPH